MSASLIKVQSRCGGSLGWCGTMHGTTPALDATAEPKQRSTWTSGCSLLMLSSICPRAELWFGVHSPGCTSPVGRRVNTWELKCDACARKHHRILTWETSRTLGAAAASSLGFLFIYFLDDTHTHASASPHFNLLSRTKWHFNSFCAPSLSKRRSRSASQLEWRGYGCFKQMHTVKARYLEEKSDMSGDHTKPRLNGNVSNSLLLHEKWERAREPEASCLRAASLKEVSLGRLIG